MIRVGFSHATGFWSFLSWIIMKSTGRNYSHVWLLLDGPDAINGTAVVLQESEKGGLEYAPYDGFGVGKVIVKVVEPPFSLRKGADALNQILGTSYDVGGLFGEGWVLFMRDWFRRKVKNPLRKPGEMWCSEAVAYAIEKTGSYPNAKTDDWQFCTPGDVDDLLAGKAID
jgi:hypothetical protein